MKTITIIKLGFDCLISLFLIFTLFSSINLFEIHGTIVDHEFVSHPFNETWNFGIFRTPNPHDTFYSDSFTFFYNLSSTIFLIGIIIQFLYYLKEYHKFFPIVSIPMIIFGIIGMEIVPGLALLNASSWISYYGTFYYEIYSTLGNIWIILILICVIMKYISIGLILYRKRKKLLQANGRGLEQYLESNI